MNSRNPRGILPIASAKTALEPPDALGKAGKKFWRQTMAEWRFTESHHIALLQQACVCLDRAAAAKEIVDRDGLTVRNQRQELKEHPSLATERASMTTFKSLVRELGMDLEDSPATKRGPGRAGSR